MTDKQKLRVNTKAVKTFWFTQTARTQSPTHPTVSAGRKEVKMRTKKRYTKEELVSILIDYVNQYGKPPTKRELNSNPTLPSDMAYRKAFGNWGNALQAAGFEVPTPYPSKQCIKASTEARRGIAGFNNKGGRIVDNHGYVLIWNANKQKYEREHRVVMEQHIGRKLMNDEDVHHINFNKTDNRIENLQLISKSEHSRLHESLGHHNHIREPHPCAFPNCSNLAFGCTRLCRRHYKLQWYRLKKGLVTSMTDFKDVERKHSDKTKSHLSELAIQQPRNNGRFCSIHDNPEMLKGGNDETKNG